MKKRWEMLWRNKFLCVDAKSFDEFIAIFEESVSELKFLREKGALLDVDSGGIGDDYATFYTEDADLAEKLGFICVDDLGEDFEAN